jgi:fructose-bisphosphate aldolase class II
MDFFNTVNTQYITWSDICAARFEAFGSAGNADKIKVSSLDTMSQRYLSGELDAKIK